MSRTTLADRLDGRPNGLNVVRLALALEVLVWHSYVLRGATLPPRATWFFACVGVDAFFAISGLLITAAWLRRPRPLTFLQARARRLLPGLWTCLVLTSFVIAPVAVKVAGGTWPSPLASLEYVLGNAAVLVTRWTIPGTTDGLADPGWNGSLWTLSWEVGCYLSVLALGVTALLRPRVLAVVVTILWALAVAVELLGGTPYGGPTWLWATLRFGLMFGLGSLVYLWREHIPYDARLAVVLGVCAVAGPLLLDNYRLLSAPGLAYGCIWVALWLGDRAWATRGVDISYGVYIYGFPLQQAMLLAGWSSGWIPFTVVSTLVVAPVALASWFLVESRFVRRSTVGRTTDRATLARQVLASVGSWHPADRGAGPRVRPPSSTNAPTARTARRRR